MIWHSILLMTIIDVVVVLGALKALQILFRHRATILGMKIARPVQAIVAGLCIISGSYLAHLYTMLVMPLYASDEAAMAAMRNLHLDWGWFVVLTGFAAIVAGLVYLMAKLFPQIATIIKNFDAEVAESKRSAEALAESEERYRTVVEDQTELICRFLPSGELTFVNEAYCRYFDRTREGLLDHKFMPLIPQEDREEVEAFFASLGPEIPVGTHEHRVIAPDGQIRWQQWTNRTICDGQGNIVELQAVGRDITERKQAEEALRESEEQIRLITDNIPVLISYVDKSVRYRFNNKTYIDWFGLSPEELAGREVREVIGDAAYEACEPHINQALSGKTVNYEVTLAYARGGPRSIQTCQVPHFDKDGTVKGFFSIVTDITETKRLEAELLRRERLATLGQLTATVSHELRNPLGVIRTSVFLLRDGLKADMPRALRALQRVERSVVRCDRIINELLDFTRISDLEPEPTALDDWLAGVLEEQSLPAGIILRQELQLPETTVPFDRDRFRRAVINVFDNACQAMRGADEGEAEPAERLLTVRTRERDGRIEVVFEDQGPGIAPDVYERIFEPLYSTKGFGVGLGLPVVKQIMERHGGGIEIETEEGRGTAVCLWLDPDREGRAWPHESPRHPGGRGRP